MSDASVLISIGWIDSAPDPAGGAYSAPPDPLLDLKDKLLSGKKRKRRERTGEKGGYEGRGLITRIREIRTWQPSALRAYKTLRWTHYCSSASFSLSYDCWIRCFVTESVSGYCRGGLRPNWNVGSDWSRWARLQRHGGWATPLEWHVSKSAQTNCPVAHVAGSSREELARLAQGRVTIRFRRHRWAVDRVRSREPVG